MSKRKKKHTYPTQKIRSKASPVRDLVRDLATAGMQMLDITRNVPLSCKESGVSVDQRNIFATAKQFMADITPRALKANHIFSKMSNLSNDSPVKLLSNANTENILAGAMCAFQDDDCVQSMAEVFHSLFGQEYDSFLAKCVSNAGKSLDELTDDECKEAASEFAREIGIRLYSSLLEVQNISEIYNCTKANPAREDIVDNPHYANTDYIDWERKFNHIRSNTKVEYCEPENPYLSAQVDERATSPELHAEIKVFYDKLSEKQKQLLKMKLCGNSEEEIAKALNCRKNTVGREWQIIKKMWKDEFSTT